MEFHLHANPSRFSLAVHRFLSLVPALALYVLIPGVIILSLISLVRLGKRVRRLEDYLIGKKGD